MPKKLVNKLKLVKKFLDDDTIDEDDADSLKSILKLPVSAYKFISEEEAEHIKTLFKAENIGDMVLVDSVDPFKNASKSKAAKALLGKLKKEDPEFEERVKKAATISLIARRLKKKSIKIEERDQKIIVIGLNNAGKTAILTKFGGRLGISDLATLRPTKGINRQEITTDSMNMLIWDFGGQKGYRDKYLRTPEKYFINVHLIIFVIDVQDTERYDESIEYFEKIIDVVTALEQTPYFLCFIHKYDPDLREDEEINLNVELLKDLIKSIFKGKKLDYDIFLSSIYSMIANEPMFSRFIKDMMQDQSGFIEPGSTVKIEELAAVIEKTLNAVVRLSEAVSKQYAELSDRIERLETTGAKKSKGMPAETMPSPEYSSAPLPPPPPPPSASTEPAKPSPSTQSVRGAIISELKEMFAKRGKLS